MTAASDNPWTEAGISRATWYRRHCKETHETVSRETETALRARVKNLENTLAIYEQALSFVASRPWTETEAHLDPVFAQCRIKAPWPPSH